MDYRRFLRDELLKRQSKNRAYSLRAFARDLEMSSSRLSEILNGKVGISESRASALAERLQLSLDDRELFVDMVESEHARSAVLRNAAADRVKSRYLEVPVLAEEEMNLMSDWYHLPLLEMVGLANVEQIPAAFAKKLGVDEAAVVESLSLLEKLGYLKKVDGKWAVTDPVTTTTNNIPSPSIKRYHSQMLDKARSALLEEAPSERDFTSIVFAMNSEQIEYAKKRIREFRRSLVQDLEAFPNKDKIFYLSMNMFSLTDGAE